MSKKLSPEKKIKNFLKNFKKPLDISHIVWYPMLVKMRERKAPEKEKEKNTMTNYERFSAECAYDSCAKSTA